MMLASPMMTASPDDVWLRHILRQTSHHCETKWSNIILSEAKNMISPYGDASFSLNISPHARFGSKALDTFTDLWYNRCNKKTIF